MDGLDGYGWDLCVGLLYEHRFAMLIKYSKINFLVTGAEPFRGDIISTTQYGLDVTFHQDSVTIIIYISVFFLLLLLREAFVALVPLPLGLSSCLLGGPPLPTPT